MQKAWIPPCMNRILIFLNPSKNLLVFIFLILGRRCWVTSKFLTLTVFKEILLIFALLILQLELWICSQKYIKKDIYKSRMSCENNCKKNSRWECEFMWSKLQVVIFNFRRQFLANSIITRKGRWAVIQKIIHVTIEHNY